MKKNNIEQLRFIQIGILLFVVLLFINCTGSSFGDSQKKVDDDFKTGVGSLDMTFDRNSPPRQLIQEQQSVVVLQLQNNGAFEIQNGFVSLNIDSSVLRITDNAMFKRFSLEGRSANFPRGEETVVTFPIQTRQLSQESQVQKTQIIASACYDYATEVFTEICIDADPHNLRDTSDKVCQVDDVRPGNSGGIVNVENIEVSFIQHNQFVTPSITIHLQKSGSDLVYEYGRGAYFCTSSATSRDTAESVDVVDLQVVLSDRVLECNTNRVTFQDNGASITCTGLPIDTDLTQTFKAPLLIVLEYGIMSSTSTSIDVVRQR